LTSKAAPFRVERLLQRGVDVGLEEERERGSGRGHCVVFVSEKEKRFGPKGVYSFRGWSSLWLSLSRREAENGVFRGAEGRWRKRAREAAEERR
jgi:hypothetical protein